MDKKELLKKLKKILVTKKVYKLMKYVAKSDSETIWVIK